VEREDIPSYPYEWSDDEVKEYEYPKSYTKARNTTNIMEDIKQQIPLKKSKPRVTFDLRPQQSNGLGMVNVIKEKGRQLTQSGRKTPAPSTSEDQQSIDREEAWRRRKKCRICGKGGHTEAECFKLRRCGFCHEKGHNERICPKGCEPCSGFRPHLKTEPCVFPEWMRMMVRQQDQEDASTSVDTSSKRQVSNEPAL